MRGTFHRPFAEKCGVRRQPFVFVDVPATDNETSPVRPRKEVVTGDVEHWVN